MIQRIQTLFLLIALVLEAVLFFQPLAVLQLDDATFYEIFVKGYVFNNQIQYSFSLLIFTFITLLLNLIIIFLYKKRILQMRLAIYNTILLIGLQGVIAYTIYATSDNLNAEIFLQYAAILPIIIAILHLIAFKYIKRDEELVRSADRIR
ncbi:MAG TPA: DUF4293 family protein [Bacteroidales bacterium]|jgi:CDP-diglyceride synthetase|nr:DUF4293 domain-containing protein [Bacteroidales bacterium]HNV95687.1 DUF4293 family protein [Bacteroidales bacterium]HOU97599.1 DUF4293 family protein [Bacteroidales bacterium]